MRFRFAVLVAVTSFLTVSSPALAGPRPTAGSHTAAADLAYVHRLLYTVGLAEFVRTTAVGDRWFDWSTDGCSAPLVGDTGLSFNFREACMRHDFGYRNLQLLEHRYGGRATFWNAATRQRVDGKFLSDMRNHCRTRALMLQAQCFGWAQTFYVAVRVAGGP